MRIAIDARFYGEAGPGRYVSQLLKKIQDLDHENNYVVYLKKSNFNDFHPTNPNFIKNLADYHWYSFAEQTHFLQTLYLEKFDLVHFTQMNVPLLYLRPFVVTIHDVILHEFSTERGGFLKRLLYRLKRIPYNLIFAKDVYLSRSIIVPSQATKKDLMKYYPINSRKINVIYESVDHYPSSKMRREDLGILRKYGIIKPYILALGSFYPHKNLDSLVKAYKIVRRQGAFPGQLVLVGKESYFSGKLRQFARDEGIPDVVFPAVFHPLGYLPDDEVEPILANAHLYVQPSLKEGFGIPPVEAMVFGVPTVVSKIPCLEEMCGDAAVYFNPADLKDLVEKLIDGLSDQNLRKTMISRGLENIKRFSWERMALETLNVYQDVLHFKNR